MERTFQMGSTLMHQLSLGFVTAVSIGVLTKGLSLRAEPTQLAAAYALWGMKRADISFTLGVPITGC